MGWKGGYGTYKMRPAWDVYGSGLMMGDSTRPLPQSQWRSPRRSSSRPQGGIYSTPGVIDLYQNRAGTYQLNKPFRLKAQQAMKKLGPGAAIVSQLLPFMEKVAMDMLLPPLLPEGEQLAYNTTHWVKRCTGASPSGDCIGWPSTGYTSSNDAFCGRATQPPAWTGTGRKHIYVLHARCDSGGYPWYTLRWTSGLTAAAYNTRPVYWSPTAVRPAVYIPPEIFPDGVGVNQPSPRPNHIPYRLRTAARKAQNRLTPQSQSGPAPVRNPPPPITPVITPHQNVRPDAGVVEQKRRVPAWLRKLLAWALVTTEWRDIIDAIADGLGYNDMITVHKNGFTYKVRAVPKTVPVMQFLYNRWLTATDAQLQQAILNVIMNEIEDKIIGRLQSPISVPGVGTFRQMGNAWVLTQ